MAKEKKDDDFRYLVRIANTDIDGNKKVPVGLSSIKGIGTRVGGVICSLSGVDPNKKMGYLTEKETEKLDDIAKAFHTQKVPTWLFNRRKDYDTGKDRHILGSDLIMSLREDINRLRKIRSYRGIRHEQGLPARGQRTRTSFRKGATVGVRRKKAKQ
jgi:small subunit ribosomal protein S13